MEEHGIYIGVSPVRDTYRHHLVLRDSLTCKEATGLILDGWDLLVGWEES